MLDMEKKVSVILPIYNVEEFLPKSIESVMNQTYRNLEIVLVDDGSTDSCPKICDDYAQKDKRIKVIHKKNGGLSSARNAGINMTSGEFIYFLDSDDYIETNLVEMCVAVIQATMCDVVVFNHVIESESKEEIGTIHFSQQHIITDTIDKKMKYISNILLKYQVGWNAWNRFYKADIIKDNKLYYPDNNVIFAEDQAFALLIALYQKKMVVIDNVLYHYLQRGTSIMGKNKKPPLSKFVKLCLDYENYVETLNETTVQCFEKYKVKIFLRLIINELKYSSNDFNDAVKRIIDLPDNEKEQVLTWLRKEKKTGFFKIRNREELAFYLYLRKLLKNVE